MPQKAYEKYLPRASPGGQGGQGDREPAYAKYLPEGAPEVVEEQHPELSYLQRTAIQTVAPSKESALKYLRERNFEAEIIGDEIALRRPGERKWHRVDPSKLEWADLTDIADELFSGVSMGIGAGLAGTGGTAAAPGVGTIAAGAAGAAGGAAAAEGIRRGIGGLVGFEQEGALETAKDIGKEALAGGVFQGGLGLAGKAISAAKPAVARGLSKIAPALKRPLEREAVGKQIRTAEGYIAPFRSSAERAATARDIAGVAVGKEVTFLKEQAARVAARAAKETDEAIKAGRKGVSRETVKETSKATFQFPRGGKVPDFPEEFLNPARGLTAKTLKEFPGIVEILNRNFTDEFAPRIWTLSGQEIQRGAWDMATRTAKLRALRGRWGEQRYWNGTPGGPGGMRGFYQDMAAFIRGHRAFRGTKLPRQVEQGTKEILQGKITIENTTTVMNHAFRRMGVKSAERTAKLRKLQADYQKARTRSQSARADVRSLEDYHGLRDLLRKKRELGPDPLSPGLFRHFGRVSTGGLIGGAAGGLPGAAIGAAVGATAPWVARRGLAGLGKLAGRLAELLSREMPKDAPREIRGLLMRIRRLREQKGEIAAKGAAYALLTKNPTVRAWIEGAGAAR